MNIWRLIVKDLRLQSGFFPLLLAIEIGGVAIFHMQLNPMPGVLFTLANGVALIGDFLLAYRTLVSEEKNRALLLVRILPVSIREIVLSKAAVNLLLCSLNLALCFALLGVLQAADVVPPQQISWSLGLLPFLAFHWLVNGLFVAIGLVASSDRAVWIPFPALFIVLSFMLNYKKIVASAGLDVLSDKLLANNLALSAVLVTINCIGILLAMKLVTRKRMFG